MLNRCLRTSASAGRSILPDLPCRPGSHGGKYCLLDMSRVFPSL